MLVPGPTDSWRSYGPVLDGLPERVHAIAVSPRGHGDSDKPADGYRVEDFAGDVVPMLDAFGIGRAVLVGHSGSCLVVRRVALDAADRVAGLVLEASPLVLVGNPGLTEFVESAVQELDDPIDPAFVRSWVTDTSSDTIDAGVIDELVDEVAKVPARVWRAMFAALLTYDDRAELDRITAPALLIWGDADPIVGREVQEELGRRLPDANVVQYDGVGHTPRWEDPARFAADLVAFVDR